jgi:hypothetical protein
VVDVTDFSAKTDYQGSRENLHLIERWTRTGPTSLEYVATIEDATVWTRPWTVKQEFTRQSEEMPLVAIEAELTPKVLETSTMSRIPTSAPVSRAGKKAKPQARRRSHPRLTRLRSAVGPFTKGGDATSGKALKAG